MQIGCEVIAAERFQLQKSSRQQIGDLIAYVLEVLELCFAPGVLFAILALEQIAHRGFPISGRHPPEREIKIGLMHCFGLGKHASRFDVYDLCCQR